MMKKAKLEKSKLVPFVYWVKCFIDKHDLLKNGENPQLLPVLLVSGGADSSALLHVLLTLNHKFIPLYFHHKTRSEMEHRKDISVIKNILKYHRSTGNELVVAHLQGMKLTHRNFEREARVARKKYIEKHYPQSVILSAHHLDDSFEWWLRGKLTQSRAEMPLGIPLRAGNYVRPFMCVSKKHILNFLARENIFFHEDSSNQNEKFERNFLRKNIISQIAPKYPKYLKHYVARQNQKAIEQNVHIDQKKIETKMIIKKLAQNLWFFSLEKNNTIEDLHKILLSKSNVDRGMIHKALGQFFGGKLSLVQIRGPMSFSGGLHLWQWHHHFFLWKNPIRPESNLAILDNYLQQNIAHIQALKRNEHYSLEIMGLEIIKSANFHSKYFKEILAFKKWTPIFYQELVDQDMKLVIRTEDV